jgi:hypothetical protein
VQGSAGNPQGQHNATETIDRPMGDARIIHGPHCCHEARRHQRAGPLAQGLRVRQGSDEGARRTRWERESTRGDVDDRRLEDGFQPCPPLPQQLGCSRPSPAHSLCNTTGIALGKTMDHTEVASDLSNP